MLPRLSLLSILLVAAAGCAKGAPPTETGAAPPKGDLAVTPVSNSKAAEAKDPAKAVTKPGEKDAAAKGREAPSEPPKETFAPPFSKRTDIFRKPNVAVARTQRAEKQAGGVELKGFVNAEKLKAILLLEGQIVMAAQGEQRGDLEVIEVKPPQVILQRGRNRWTIAMFDANPPGGDENSAASTPSAPTPPGAPASAGPMNDVKEPRLPPNSAPLPAEKTAPPASPADAKPAVATANPVTANAASTALPAAAPAATAQPSGLLPGGVVPGENPPVTAATSDRKATAASTGSSKPTASSAAGGVKGAGPAGGTDAGKGGGDAKPPAGMFK